MIPCISQVTTLSTAFEDDLNPYARAGFTAVEIWLTKLETFLETGTIADVSARLEREGLRAVAAASQGGLLLGRGPERVERWRHFRARLELLRQLAIPTLVVAADFDPSPPAEAYRHAAEALAEAGELAGEAGVRLALEFQKGSGFCSCLETAVALVSDSGSSAVGVCLDLFHYQTGPSKAEDLDLLDRGNLAHVQISDLIGTPREVAGDSDRVLPGDGSFRIGPILERLAAIGYDGPVSLEVLNPSFWAIPADRVADFGYQATARALGGRSIRAAEGDA